MNASYFILQTLGLEGVKKKGDLFCICVIMMVVSVQIVLFPSKSQACIFNAITLSVFLAGSSKGT